MPTERNIHGERDDGHWTVWFTDTPQTAFGGGSSAEALSRLVRMTPEIYSRMRPISDRKTVEAGAFEFALDFELSTCPDCGGSGKYTGLIAVEPRGQCQGRGRVRHPVVGDDCSHGVD